MYIQWPAWLNPREEKKRKKIKEKGIWKNPDTILWDKELPGLPLSSLSVGHLLLHMQPPLKNGDIPLEKIKFSFAGGYWLEIYLASGMKVCVYFFSQL